jgi:PIN domain nuclease of toxin-antitoxin system
VDLGPHRDRRALPRSQARVILLDTNALIWLSQGHTRARPLVRAGRVYISPASLLELQFLHDLDRIRLTGGVEIVAHDDRWTIDDPSAVSWFLEAAELSWTRDPFDRLIVAHARLRGWKLATGDDRLLKKLGDRERLAL